MYVLLHMYHIHMYILNMNTYTKPPHMNMIPTHVHVPYAHTPTHVPYLHVDTPHVDSHVPNHLIWTCRYSSPKKLHCLKILTLRVWPGMR